MTKIVRASSGGGASSEATVRALWGPMMTGLGTGGGNTVSSVALNDSDNSVASVLQVEKDGTINRIGFSVSAANGTPSINVGLVGLTTGNPNTTAHGGSAIEVVTSWSVGFVWVTLATPATVQAGQEVAARIWPSGAGNVPDGTHNITVPFRSSLVTNIGQPHPEEFTTAWTKRNNYPHIAVRYSDGSVGPIVPNVGTSLVSTAFNSGTTPDEIGCLFQLPFAATCIGARMAWDPATGSDGDLKLYNAGSTEVASATLTVANTEGVNNQVVDVFWDPVSLAADTNYRLTHLPSNATSRQLVQVTLPDTDSRGSIPEGSRWQRTERTDAGSWTETDTVMPMMSLWLSNVTVPA